jgi:hypothetical protein
MDRAFASVVAAIAVVGAGGTGAVPEQPRRLAAGPVFAGGGVAWAERTPGRATLRLARAGRIRVVERLRPNGNLRLAGSPRHLVLARGTQTCGEGEPCVAGEAAFAGPPAGPLRPIVAPASCKAQNPWNGPEVDVDRDVATFADGTCWTRAVLVDLSRGPRTIRVLRGRGCCNAVRVAGRFYAQAGPSASAVAVYDLRTGKRVYRVVTRTPLASYDIQNDGKIAFVVGTNLSWASAARPRPHRIATDVRSAVRIARDRVAFMRMSESRQTEVVVAALSGDETIVARYDFPDRSSGDVFDRINLDFDGRRVTWAADDVTSRRSDCPRTYVGRPCFYEESGVTLVLTATVGARPRALARFTFANRRT